jgi:pilus assembly protein FimV
MAFPRTFALMLLAPALASAADLGRLTVRSGVGEPLLAEIEITSVRPGEAGSLRARIPPPEVFWRANLEPSPALAALRVGVEARSGRGYVVTLRSNEPIDTPFIQVLVELDSRAGAVVREYPFLLEERSDRSLAAAPTVLLPRVDATPQRPLSPLPPSPGSGGPRANLPPEGTYLVSAGDTLAGIARATMPPGATIEQMLVALYHANEQAFAGGNMNRLRAGAVLVLPPEDQVRALGQTEAQRTVRAHQASLKEELAHKTDASTAADNHDGPTERPYTRDRLRLSSPEEERKPTGAGISSDEDDRAALQGILAGAEARIALLEKSLQDVRRLLAQQDGQPESDRPTPRRPSEAVGLVPGNSAVNAHNELGTGRLHRHGVLGEYGGWLLGAFLLGYVLWVVMPLKTARAWRARRRRRALKEQRRALVDWIDVRGREGPGPKAGETLSQGDIIPPRATRRIQGT